MFLFRRQLLAPILCLFLVLPASLRAAGKSNIGILGAGPKWSVLERYQETITRADFLRLLDGIYCTHGRPERLISVGNENARILMRRDPDEYFTLRFAPNEREAAPVPRLWRGASSLTASRPESPLAGIRIALDPGHLGGDWAKMEERWFQRGNAMPVTEGDMTLRVSRLVATRLRELGARVSFVRNTTEPVTPLRPDDFKELARTILVRNGIPEPRAEVLNPDDPEKEQTIKWQSEILFYRYSEIRKRAVLVNTKLHPDLVLCLHFNAEGWDDPKNPTLVDHNHLHLLMNGSYLTQELEFDDERFEMIRRLLSRAGDEELPLADTIATAMARETGLPAYQYPTDNYATHVGASGYVYARNLLATRLYRCPVVYCEPYVMNNQEVFDRVQAGEYEEHLPRIRRQCGRRAGGLLSQGAAASVETEARSSKFQGPSTRETSNSNSLS